MSSPSTADIYHPQGVQFSLRDLLVDADRTARRMLTRPSRSNGTSLLAGWDTVLAAAGDVITSVQTPVLAGPPMDVGAPTGQPAAAAAGRLIDQLTAETRALEVAQVPSLLHPDLEHLVHTWQQAVGVHAQEQLRWEPSERPHRAVGRVLGTLATVAHATQSALAGGGPGVDALGQEQTERFHRLLQRHEQLTLRTVRAFAVGPVNPAATSGREPATGAALPALRPDVTTPPAAAAVSNSALDRLSAQLASWGRLATAAAADPDTPDRDLRRIASAEAMTTSAARFLVAAAAQQHDLPAHAVPHTQRRLETATEHWRVASRQWEWLRRRGTQAPATLSVDHASQDLARAVRAAVKALPQAAGPVSSSATTPSRAQASPMTVARQITENSAILAEVFARLPARAHRLDSDGRLRPTLAAPLGIQHRIVREARLRELRLRPDAEESDLILTVPLSPGSRHDLRAINPETAAFLLARGEDLARAATSAEQALSAAVGTSRVSAARPSAPSPAPMNPATMPDPSAPSRRPAAPHSPRQSSPGNGFDR